MATDQQKDRLERKSSKSRLSKQAEIEEVEEEDNSPPSSEASDATIVPATGIATPVVNSPGESPDSNSPDDNKKLESQRSIDSDKISPTQCSNPKVKLLVRSEAVCDDTSPPPEDTTSKTAGLSNTASSLSPTVATLSPTPQLRRQKLEKAGSQGSTISENGNSPRLSRDSSFETQYTDSTGIDLENFLKQTLNKNPKDRSVLLKLEQDMTDFIKDAGVKFYKFPPMSSYHRMLVHRVAAFFGLDHNVDQSGKSVVVNRMSNTRIPDFKFTEHVLENGCQGDQQKKQILKRNRDCLSLEEQDKINRHLLDGKTKSKSFEERAEEYEKTRARIFNQNESQSSQEGIMELPVRCPISQQSSTRSSKEDLRSGDPRTWSSTESSGYSTDGSTKLKLAMTKASSFHGVTVLSRGEPSVLSRGDSKSSTYSTGSRLSKGDSTSSGVSSLLNSPMARPPPVISSPHQEGQLSESGSSSGRSATSPCQQPQAQPGMPLGFPITNEQGQALTIWVATTMDKIPAGSVIINQQTGQPYLNPDGSIYHWPSISSPQNTQPPPIAQQAMVGQVQGCQGVQQGVPSHHAAPTFAPQSQPPVITHDNRTFSLESSGSDISQQFSSMTITPQSSTESMHDVPAAGQPTQQVYASATPQQPPAATHQHLAPHQGFVPSQQVPYYTANQPAAGAASMRYVFPAGYPAQQGQIQGQGSAEVPHGPQPGQSQTQQNGQYGSHQPYVQNYGYQMMSFPQMTVQSVETYQQPGYQPGGSTVQGYPGGPGTQQGAPHDPSSQTTYTQYQPGSTMSQGSHVQSAAIPMYYSSAVTSGSQVMNYAAMGSPISVPSQGPYRPRTPPSQAVGSLNPTGPVCSLGQQHMGAGGVSSQQFMSYTTYPQTVAPQRGQTPQMLPYGPGLSATQPAPQGFQVAARPGMQIGMPVQQQTTPPPPATHFAPVTLLPGTSLKMVNLEQRPQKPTELFSADGTKDPTANGTTLLAQGQGHPVHQKTIPTAIPQIRPVGGMPFRGPSPVSSVDARLVGQPLQQMPRAALLAARPRLPLGGVQPQSSGKALRGRKAFTRSGSKDSVSPQSSTESSGCMLEVSCLPHNLRRSDLDSYLCDLTQQGARLHVVQDDCNNVTSKTGCNSVSGYLVLAVFDSELTAQRVLSSHAGSKYKLRPASSRQYELATQPEIPS